MVRFLQLLAVAVLGIALGVGGTLGAQALNNDEPSASCAIATDWANEAIAGGGQQHDTLSGEEWRGYLAQTDMLLDVRYKICNQ